MARIIEFEGRRIEVPDDATDDEVAGILEQSSPQAPATSAAPTAAAPATAAPSMLDSVMRGADYAAGTVAQGLRGLRQGFSNVVGLPVDAMNNAPRALNLLPGVSGIGRMTDKPFMGSDYVDSALGGFGAVPEPAAPQGLVQRGARRVGEELGAAAVPVGGAMMRGAQLGPAGVRAAGSLLDTIMGSEAAAVNPGKFLGAQASAAAGAGIGATGANELARMGGVDPNSGAGAAIDVAGAMGGAGATALAGGLLKSGANIVRAVRGSPNYVDDVVKEAVVDKLAEAAGLQAAPGAPVDTTALVDQIMRGPRVTEAVPGFRESVADRTANPGLAAMEYGRQSGPNSGMYTQRRADNTRAIDDAFAQFEPQGTPGAFRSELDANRTQRLTDATAEADAARKTAETAMAPLQPQGTPATRGNTVRTALEDARDEARMQTSAAYEAADVGGVQVDAKALAKPILDYVAGLDPVERALLPGVVDAVAGLAQKGGNVALSVANNLRSELSRMQRAALADPRAERGGRNAARVIGGLESQIDDFIAASVSPEQQAALQAAREAKFNEAERFTRAGDPVASALSRYEGGQPRMRDERVAGTFTNPQNMDRLLSQVDTPDVRRAIRDEMLSRADLSSAEGLQGFMRDNFDALQRFPGLDNELASAAAARGNADVAATKAAEMTDTLTKQGKSAVANYLSYADENADRAMRGVLAARDPKAAADELLSFVNDSPNAVEGARKVFWDIMTKTSKRAGETTATIDGAQPWMPKALKRFLDDPRNAAVAERLYRDNPEHLANIRKISDAIQGVDVRNSAKTPNNSGTAQSILPSAETVGSRIFAFQRGQVGGGWLVTNLAAIVARRALKGARTDAIERMLDEALLNPEAAATLLKENNPVNRAALARSARAYLGNEASTIVNALSAEEPQDELKSKVMDNGR